MKIQSVYSETYKDALLTQKFSVGHLYQMKSRMNIDTIGCYKIFFIVSGNKKFHIGNKVYDVKPGDLYLVNQREYHYFSKVDHEESQERIVCFIYPDFLKSLCTENTDLTACFHIGNMRKDTVCSKYENLGEHLHHRYVLNEKEQSQFLYYIEKLSRDEGLGQDVFAFSVFLELMVFVNRIVNARKNTEEIDVKMNNPQSQQLREILAYINLHITEEITVEKIAAMFYISTSYLCRIFKQGTGTTIHQYITAKRITYAKDLLAEGHTCLEVSSLSGFKDYNGFWKCFVKAVGVSPAKYAQFNIGK